MLPVTLLHVLGDGRFHSGEQLAAQLGVSRAAVWKAVRALRSLGMPTDAVRGRGYRLQRPFEPLQAPRLTAHLSEAGRSLLGDVDVHLALDSTSRWLRERASQGAKSGSLCLAEAQTAGRGRRERTWLSPLTGNIYLSVLWRFDHLPPRLGTLGLALGVAVAQALAARGVEDVALKWPNDLVWRGRKLGGLLIDANAQAAGPCSVVVGFGLNVHLPDPYRVEAQQPVVDLAEIAPDVAGPRNRLAGVLVDALLRALGTFQTAGFPAFARAWQGLDAVAGREVEVRGPTASVRGTACGVDADGALQVLVDGAMHRYSSGDVSVRAA
ncbi:biotin--[acetyl-CoA-carboxylase] ligase [Ectothiorhodospiraceae bacterium 2226]|nr:biotin--[acetyl-CoA-carboxylase] ligase [Ectothiorhodospiraceae bacterium 2226]